MEKHFWIVSNLEYYAQCTIVRPPIYMRFPSSEWREEYLMTLEYISALKRPCFDIVLIFLWPPCNRLNEMDRDISVISKSLKMLIQ